MLFAVPTMYHRLADAAERDADVAAALRARGCWSRGSAALPAAEHERIERADRAAVVERYGMTETLMNTAVRADGERRAGLRRPAAGRASSCGWSTTTARARRRRRRGDRRDPRARPEPVPRLPEPARRDREALDATAGSTPATSRRARADGYIRIVGRRATDLIKSGGFKIGAGEIEDALLEHPAVAEAAVTGEPDDDLGERIVAWVVAASRAPAATEELADHVAGAAHAAQAPARGPLRRRAAAQRAWARSRRTRCRRDPPRRSGLAIAGALPLSRSDDAGR